MLLPCPAAVGIPVDEDITTVEEARDAILALWKKAKYWLLRGG